jgi:hypothetical protein
LRKQYLSSSLTTLILLAYVLRTLLDLMGDHFSASPKTTFAQTIVR